VVAAGGRLVKGQEPEKGVVIPVLIEGLRGHSFTERHRSQRALFLVTKVAPEQLCVDPTDPPAKRADGVRGWEEWWAENKGKLSREKIPAHY
jgi:hypothetical protein